MGIYHQQKRQTGVDGLTADRQVSVKLTIFGSIFVPQVRWNVTSWIEEKKKVYQNVWNLAILVIMGTTVDLNNAQGLTHQAGFKKFYYEQGFFPPLCLECQRTPWKLYHTVNNVTQGLRW